MKLNPDCIRDLMLFFEEHTYIKTHKDGALFGASYHVIYANALCDLPPFTQYEPGEILYHIIQLAESGYLATDFKFDPLTNFMRGNVPRIYYVTPKGHEFIASIEEKNRWEKTSKVLKTFGTVSLTVIETISKGIAAAAIEEMITPKA